MGAPSRRPPAKPIAQALSRSLICASVGMPDGGCEICVRRDWALAKSQSANETITTIANFVLKVIGIPICSIHDMNISRQNVSGPFGISKRARKRLLLSAAIFSCPTRVEVRIRLQRFRSFPRLLDAGRCGQLVKFPCLLGVPAHAKRLQ